LLDPEIDLYAIQSLLWSDSTLLSYVNLPSDATLAQKARIFIKRSNYGTLANNECRVCLFYPISRSVRNEGILEQVLQINVHVPLEKDYNARRAIRRIHELLHGRTINGRWYYLEAILTDLPTASNYYCVGSRYNFYFIK